MRSNWETSFFEGDSKQGVKLVTIYLAIIIIYETESFDVNGLGNSSTGVA